MQYFKYPKKKRQFRQHLSVHFGKPKTPKIIITIDLTGQTGQISSKNTLNVNRVLKNQSITVETRLNR